MMPARRAAALVPGAGASHLRGPGERTAAPQRIAAIAAVFLLALGLRLLYFANARADLYGVDQERYRIAYFYHQAAASILEGEDTILFPRGISPEDTLPAGYPPGYFAFMAAVYALAGDDMAAVLAVQCVLDAAAAVVLLLLGEALFSTGVGFVAGLLMAFSPQFASLSVVVKPDTLTVLPIALAVLLLVRALERRRLGLYIAAGLALGVACWLRQNALLLAPALSLAVLAIRGWRGAGRGALALTLTCAAVVAPITARNAIIYGELVPVTFGSGFALLSGLARDDYAGRYDLPRFAYNVSLEEARARGLPPDHYFAEYDRIQAQRRRKYDVKHTVLSVFALDGIARDRERSQRALALISGDPLYFASIYWLRVGRLLGYTPQLRAVPIAVGPRDHAYEMPGYFAPLGTLDPYYAREGRFYDRLRPLIAMAQGAFVTRALLAGAAVGLLLALVAGWRRAFLLLVLPVYYLGMQSFMWAEFRHTLPIHLAVFILIGVVGVSALRALRLLLGAGRSGAGERPGVRSPQRWGSRER